MSRLIWYPGHDVLIEDVVRADNCSLFDSGGRRYVDLESGVWCTSIGHGHPAVLRAIAEQSARIAHTGFCYKSEVVEEAARDVLGLLGLDGGRCVFLCSGAEAVEYGVRVAQLVASRPLLMIMAESYCGAYGSARRKDPSEWFSFDWTGCAACSRPGASCEGCERWAAVPWDRTGGFLLEPGSSGGMVRFPPARLVQSIARKLTDTDGLLLVNEVTTGVGRTGRWFGYEHYGVSPDIVALGKGIGNGYPVSVAAIGPRVAARLGDRPVPYAQSHQNDPLGAAVVRAVIKVIRDGNLIERGRELGCVLLEGLEWIKATTGRIREIRARGLIVAIELEGDAARPFAARVHRELVRRGFVLALRPGTNVLRLDPSLTIERADIEGFLAALEAVLEEQCRGSA
jgi:acetylornithine aminotransferase